MKTVTKTKKKKEELEDWTVIWCDTTEDVEQCISDPTVIWPILERVIGRMMKEGRETLPAIEIRCTEMMGSVWVNVRRSEVLVTLNKLLNWRLDREEYEECAIIRDMIDQYVSDEDRRKSATTEEK